jgi:hypothetical protein
MSESEETKWRLDGVEPEEAEERAAELYSEEDENKEELQQTVQTNAEEIGGEGEGSIITRPEEVPITEAQLKNEKIVKTKRPTVKREPDSGTNIAKISKQTRKTSKSIDKDRKSNSAITKVS